MVSPISCEVAVVGLGAMGAATLYQLARRGVKVVGIDRFTPPHDHGSSHGDTRITRLALGEGAEYLPFARRSHEIWRELEAANGRTLFRQTGGLVFSSLEGRSPAHGNADFLQTTIDVARRHQIPHEVLDASTMAKRFPQFKFAGDETGCFEPTAGLVHPEACIATQLELAQQLGARTITQCRVQRWLSDGSGVVIETDRGPIRADRLVLTAGAWLPQLVPGLRPLTRICRQVLYWFDLDHGTQAFDTEDMPIFIRVPDSRADMFYGFPPIDGRHGGLKIATEQFSDTCEPDQVSREVRADEAHAMYRLASPHVRIQPRLLRSAVCKYTITPDFHFLIDRHPDSSHVWLASACSGHGFKHSAAVGEYLASQVTENGRASECESGNGWGFDRLKQRAVIGC